LGGESPLAMVQSIFHKPNVLLVLFFNIKLPCFSTIPELSFHFTLVIQVQLDSEAVLEPIEKLSKVNFTIIEKKKSFVYALSFDGVPEINAIFELFYGRILDDDITRKAEIAEKVEYL
jgi:hypothetical protein